MRIVEGHSKPNIQQSEFPDFFLLLIGVLLRYRIQ